MRKISSKLIVLLVSASLVPLITFGVLSLLTSRRTTSKLVTEANIKVAHRAAEEVALYLDNSIRILKAISVNINRTHLRQWEKEAILRDYVLQFKEFQTIHLLNSQGKVVVTSSIKKPPTVPGDEDFRKALKEGIPYRSKVFVTDELIPTISLGFPVTKRGEQVGMVLGVVNLIDVWRVVDQIKVGQQGYALIVSRKRQLLAHGNPELKPLVIEQKVLDSHPLLQEINKDHLASGIYQNKQGLRILSVGVPIPGTDWTLLIDQPHEEAFIDARIMTRRLSIFVISFTILACVVGLTGGRRYVIEPIKRLIQASRAFARGDLDQRVQISTKDEFGELGQAFNTMASDLELLKADIRRKEREATLGLIAHGLVHDLKHPIKNIENMTSLLDRLFEDEEYRTTFKKTVRRELATINRYFDDLADIATTKPLQCISLNLPVLLGELCDRIQTVAEAQGVELVRDFSEEPQTISADIHALDRIFSNLFSNALDAMPKGGKLNVATRILSCDIEGEPDRMVEVRIEDTGPGIPPEIQEQLFNEFVTTKRRGLGLGLSIAKKLTDAHGGNITLISSIGSGTTCSVRLPLKVN